MTVKSLITDEQEKKKLRDGYVAEYKRLTGNTLICAEKIFSRSVSGYSWLAKKHLLDITSEYMSMDKTWITSSSRKPEIVKVRQMIIYLLTEMKIIREEIYPIVGYADGSTVTHSVQKIKDLLSVDKTFKQEYIAYKEYCLHELTKLIKPSKILTKEQKDAIILSLKKGGITQKELGEIYEVSRSRIQAIYRAHKQKEEAINKQKKFIRDGY
jgi:hypothetical protein